MAGLSIYQLLHIMSKASKRKALADKGEIRMINGQKVLILPAESPAYHPKRKQKSKGHVAKAFKSRY